MVKWWKTMLENRETEYFSVIAMTRKYVTVMSQNEFHCGNYIYTHANPLAY